MVKLRLMQKGQFGRRLAELRRDRCLTQAGLAARTESSCRPVSARTVSELEQGRSEPSFAVAVALAEALGVSVHAFTVEPKGKGRRGRGLPKEGE